MLKSPYTQLDTPSLLIDRDIMLANLQRMQAKAQALGVALRPHTKTHKVPEIARLQVELGAQGITVAKTGEAEVMADQGLQDIFIANEIVGELKWRRLAKLSSSWMSVALRPRMLSPRCKAKRRPSAACSSQGAAAAAGTACASGSALCAQLPRW